MQKSKTTELNELYKARENIEDKLVKTRVILWRWGDELKIQKDGLKRIAGTLWIWLTGILIQFIGIFYNLMLINIIGLSVMTFGLALLIAYSGVSVFRFKGDSISGRS